MIEIIFCILFGVAFYYTGIAFYKFIMKNKEMYNENDFAIVEYANGEEVKLFKNLETDVYEEISEIEQNPSDVL